MSEPNIEQVEGKKMTMEPDLQKRNGGEEGDIPDAKNDSSNSIWKWNQKENDDLPVLSTAINALSYSMNHPKRGTLLLFNQKNFDYKLDLRPRSGTDVDRDNVKSVFGKLGFHIQEFNDLDYFDVKQQLSKAAKDDHSDRDCFACVMLTHGDEGWLYSHDTKYKNSDLWTPFLADSCPTLAGKPKLFFIQACQGTNVDSGLKVKAGFQMKKDVETDSLQVVKIPNHADFLIACSTVPGYYSWRNVEKGSWFIQSVCDVLSRYNDSMDLLSLMTVVNHTVAYGFESNVPFDHKMNEKKQIPYICSMLTKQVFLRPK